MNAAVGRLWSKTFKPQQKLVERFDALIDRIKSARNDLEKLEDVMRQVSQFMEGISLVSEQHLPIYERIEQDSAYTVDALKDLKLTRLGLDNFQDWLLSLEIVRMGLDETIQVNHRNTERAVHLMWQMNEILNTVKSLDRAIMQMQLSTGKMVRPVNGEQPLGCTIAAAEIASLLQEKPIAALLGFIQKAHEEIQTSADRMERAMQTVDAELKGVDSAINTLKQMQTDVREGVDLINQDLPKIIEELAVIRQGVLQISNMCQSQSLLMDSVSGGIDTQIVEMDGVMASATSLKKISADLRVFPNVLHPYRDIISAVGYMIDLLERSRRAVGELADEVRTLVPPVEEQNQSSNVITTQAEETFTLQEGIFERSRTITGVVRDMPQVCSELQFNTGLLARSLNSLAETSCELAMGVMTSEFFDTDLNEIMSGVQNRVMQMRHLSVLGKISLADNGESVNTMDRVQQLADQLQEHSSAIHTCLQTLQRTYLEIRQDTAHSIAPTIRQAENLGSFSKQARRDWQKELENLLANMGSISLSARECGKRVNEAGEKLLQVTSRTHTAAQKIGQAAASASQLSRQCGDLLLMGRELRAFTGWEEPPEEEERSVAGTVPAYNPPRSQNRQLLISVLAGIGISLAGCAGLAGLIWVIWHFAFGG